MTVDVAFEHPSFVRAKSLPEPWRSHFPKSADEAQEWSPVVRFVALDACVLAVARTRVECAWCAYVAAVPGMNHRAEVIAALNYGTKMDEAVARVLFPDFKDVPYAR